MITLNGASMSRDMAQRVVPIKLSRPAFAPNWEQVTRDFARVHRWEILADIGRLLDLPPGVMVAKTRWSTWEAAVLSKLDLAVECQTLILDRQSAIDDDTAEQDLVIDHFRAQLQRLGHDPDGGPFFLPSAVAAAWLNGANNTSIPTNRASAHLKTLAIPGLETGKKSGGTPGCRWSGREANPNAEATRIEDPDIERRRRGDRERPY